MASFSLFCASVARSVSLSLFHVPVHCRSSRSPQQPEAALAASIALKTIGAPAALFLGCVLSGGEHTLRMSNGTTFISLQPLATRSELNLSVTSAADLAALIGSLASNPQLLKLQLPLSWDDRHQRGIVLDAMLAELGNAVPWPLVMDERESDRDDD